MYRLVGACFAYGMMNGAAIETVAARSTGPRTVYLVLIGTYNT